MAWNPVFRWSLIGAASALLIGCGGESGGGAGTLRVALTDAPACGFDQVNVTVERVRVHRSDSAGDLDAGWHEIRLDPARRIDLLGLTNGVLEELGTTPLPAGHYTQLRLVLRPNGGGAPANSVVPVGGVEQPLDTPSAVQSGIKLIHPFTVQPDELVDLVLDFDACRSIVVRGNGTYGLKPVIAVLPRTVAEIVGNVDPTLSGVVVSAQRNGSVVRATTPDANGAFRLAFLDPAASPYDVAVTAAGRATAVVAAVPVAPRSSTRISTPTAPIVLPASATRTASGTVTPAAALPSVRALQAVGSLPRVEVAHVNADMNGGYTLTLPTAAPLLAAYATPLPLAFAPQGANAAKYTLEASATGYVPQSASIDLTSADATQNFTLPPAP
ncbi:MAG: DUF4382 domain-containing protein [Pseudomonadota bacterium]